jgi:hypothetical protein
MSEGQTDREDRAALAEKWRRLGEKLRERSPQAYAKLIEMLATSAVGNDEEETLQIDDIYRIH